MNLDKKLSRTWARMGPRAVYGSVMSQIALQDESLLLISADLGRSSGLATFYRDHPDKFINTGIAEQNMVGFAAGLSRVGYKVFASTFAPFASMRASEQVRMNLGYMEEPVRLVALGSGVSMAFLGNSHYGLEDLSIMRSIPGITIISPADCIELYKALSVMVEHNAPTYLRITGAPSAPTVYESDYDFKIGTPNWISPKSDINVFASGSVVAQCKKAIEEIEKKTGVAVGLLNIHTLKPLPEKFLSEIIAGSDLTFIVEEHTKTGGLRGAIAELVVDQGLDSRSIFTRTLPDHYLETGEYSYLLSLYGLDALALESFFMEKIANA